MTQDSPAAVVVVGGGVVVVGGGVVVGGPGVVVGTTGQGIERERSKKSVNEHESSYAPSHIIQLRERQL